MTEVEPCNCLLSRGKNNQFLLEKPFLVENQFKGTIDFREPVTGF